MRSVVVVLPASICAMIPMFRVFASMVSASVDAGLVAVAVLIAFLVCPKHVASGTDRCPAPGGSVAGSDGPTAVLQWLEASVVREGAVRLGHSVRVLAALDRRARVIECIKQLVSQLLLHRLARAGSRCRQKPAHGQGLAARTFDLHGNLVCRAADTPGLDLDHRGRIAEGLLKHFKRGPTGSIPDSVQCAVDDPLGSALLATLHHLIDEARQNLALIACVRCRNPALDLRPTWHILSLDRSRRRRPSIDPFRRSATPTPYTRKSGERLVTSGRFSHRVQSDPPWRMVPMDSLLSADPRGRYVPTSAPWFRISTALACGCLHREHPGYPVRCGIARRAGLLPGLRALTPRSAPEDSALRRGYTP